MAEPIDELVNHRIGMERLGFGILRRIMPAIEEARDDVVDIIRKRIFDESPRGPTRSRVRQLEDALNSLNRALLEGYQAMFDGLFAELRGVAEHENDWANQFYGSFFGLKASDLASPTAHLLAAAALEKPMAGKTLEAWAKRMTREHIEETERQIRFGVMQGESVDQMVDRLKGVGAFQNAGVWPRQSRNAATLVRTAVNHISNAAHVLFATEGDNKQLFRSVQWISVLDNRTSPICRSRSGKVWSTDEDYPTPPAHPNCRSTLVFLAHDVRTGKRVVKPLEDVSYEDWLKRQPVEVQQDILGEKRYELFKTGRLSLERFVDFAGRSYTLDELKRRERDAWERAFLSPSDQRAVDVMRRLNNLVAQTPQELRPYAEVARRAWEFLRYWGNRWLEVVAQNNKNLDPNTIWFVAALDFFSGNPTIQWVHPRTPYSWRSRIVRPMRAARRLPYAYFRQPRTLRVHPPARPVQPDMGDELPRLPPHRRPIDGPWAPPPDPHPPSPQPPGPPTPPRPPVVPPETPDSIVIPPAPRVPPGPRVPPPPRVPDAPDIPPAGEVPPIRPPGPTERLPAIGRAVPRDGDGAPQVTPPPRIAEEPSVPPPPQPPGDRQGPVLPGARAGEHKPDVPAISQDAQPPVNPRRMTVDEIEKKLDEVLPKPGEPFNPNEVLPRLAEELARGGHDGIEIVGPDGRPQVVISADAERLRALTERLRAAHARRLAEGRTLGPDDMRVRAGGEEVVIEGWRQGRMPLDPALVERERRRLADALRAAEAQHAQEVEQIQRRIAEARAQSEAQIRRGLEAAERERERIARAYAEAQRPDPAVARGLRQRDADIAKAERDYQRALERQAKLNERLARRQAREEARAQRRLERQRARAEREWAALQRRWARDAERESERIQRGLDAAERENARLRAIYEREIARSQQEMERLRRRWERDAARESQRIQRGLKAAERENARIRAIYEREMARRARALERLNRLPPTAYELSGAQVAPERYVSAIEGLNAALEGRIVVPRDLARAADNFQRQILASRLQNDLAVYRPMRWGDYADRLGNSPARLQGTVIEAPGFMTASTSSRVSLDAGARAGSGPVVNIRIAMRAGDSAMRGNAEAAEMVLPAGSRIRITRMRQLRRRDVPQAIRERYADGQQFWEADAELVRPGDAIDRAMTAQRARQELAVQRMLRTQLDADAADAVRRSPMPVIEAREGATGWSELTRDGRLSVPSHSATQLPDINDMGGGSVWRRALAQIINRSGRALPHSAAVAEDLAIISRRALTTQRTFPPRRLENILRSDFSDNLVPRPVDEIARELSSTIDVDISMFGERFRGPLGYAIAQRDPVAFARMAARLSEADFAQYWRDLGVDAATVARESADMARGMRAFAEMMEGITGQRFLPRPGRAVAQPQGHAQAFESWFTLQYSQNPMWRRITQHMMPDLDETMRRVMAARSADPFPDVWSPSIRLTYNRRIVENRDLLPPDTHFRETLRELGVEYDPVLRRYAPVRERPPLPDVEIPDRARQAFYDHIGRGGSLSDEARDRLAAELGLARRQIDGLVAEARNLGFVEGAPATAERAAQRAAAALRQGAELTPAAPPPPAAEPPLAIPVPAQPALRGGITEPVRQRFYDYLAANGSLSARAQARLARDLGVSRVEVEQLIREARQAGWVRPHGRGLRVVPEEQRPDRPVGPPRASPTPAMRDAFYDYLEGRTGLQNGRFGALSREAMRRLQVEIGATPAQMARLTLEAQSQGWLRRDARGALRRTWVRREASPNPDRPPPARPTPEDVERFERETGLGPERIVEAPDTGPIRTGDGPAATNRESMNALRAETEAELNAIAGEVRGVPVMQQAYRRLPIRSQSERVMTNEVWRHANVTPDVERAIRGSEQVIVTAPDANTPMYYDPVSGTVNSGPLDPSKPQDRIYFRHEYGHHLDMPMTPDGTIVQYSADQRFGLPSAMAADTSRILEAYKPGAVLTMAPDAALEAFRRTFGIDLSGISNRDLAHRIAEYALTGNTAFLRQIDRALRAGLVTDPRLRSDLAVFSDLVGAVTRGSLGVGHPRVYFEGGLDVGSGYTSRHANEQFSNWFALHTHENAGWRNLLRRFFPESNNAAQRILDEIGNDANGD